MPWKCPDCGLANNSDDHAICPGCGFKKFPTLLKLTAKTGGKPIKIRIDTFVGKRLVKGALGDDAEFFSEEQLKVFRNKATGKWSIEQSIKAANRTFINGAALGREAADLDEGSVISVGLDKGMHVVSLEE